jgi:pyruvate, orthophosphate dikinase
MYGEYLVNAQGEDVVAGIRTPKPIAEMKDGDPRSVPAARGIAQQARNHYREVQDYEFTIERGILYCLQTRNGKMNAQGDGAQLGRNGQ